MTQDNSKNGNTNFIEYNHIMTDYVHHQFNNNNNNNNNNHQNNSAMIQDVKVNTNAFIYHQQDHINLGFIPNNSNTVILPQSPDPLFQQCDDNNTDMSCSPPPTSIMPTANNNQSSFQQHFPSPSPSPYHQYASNSTDNTTMIQRDTNATFYPDFLQQQQYSTTKETNFIEQTKNDFSIKEKTNFLSTDHSQQLVIGEENEDTILLSTNHSPTTSSITSNSSNNSSTSSTITTNAGSNKVGKLVNSELRRQIHIQSEQKRRAQIKDGFEDLRNELPSCLNKKMSKVALLHRTVQHIQHLKNTHMTMYAELERLASENEQLRKFQENVLQKQSLEKMYSSL